MNNFVAEKVLPWLVGSGLTILLIVVAVVILNKILSKTISTLVRRAIPPQGYLDPDAEVKREDTLIKVFSGVAKVLIYFIALFMILSEIGLDISPLLAGAGIAGVAFGFGAQYLVRDIITGFFLILENQFRVGDAIAVAGVSGTVEDITLRVTVIRDLDGVVHNIPNGEMTVVSNKSKDFSRVNLVVGVSYGDDIDKAATIINKVGNEIAEDPMWKDKINEAPQFLRVDNLNDSSVDLRIVGETKPLEQWAVTGELRRRIKYAFDREGIEIPYPQQVVIRKG
jgi:small-conductance mechanosensitive channel